MVLPFEVSNFVLDSRGPNAWLRLTLPKEPSDVDCHVSAANISEVNMRNSRTWGITTLFSPSAHPQICDPSLQYSRELNNQYICNFLTSRLHHIQRTENNMHSIFLLSFIYPRQLRASAEVPVIVIRHFSNSIRFPSENSHY
jgi:hypothetical protein